MGIAEDPSFLLKRLKIIIILLTICIESGLFIFLYSTSPEQAVLSLSKGVKGQDTQVVRQPVNPLFKKGLGRFSGG